MRNYSLPLVASLSFASLAACYHGASPAIAPVANPSAAMQRTSLNPDKKNAGLIYSVSAGNNVVDYYRMGTGPNNPLAGTLTGEFAAPLGMGVDRAGDLYVSNGNDKNVLVFKAGSKSSTGTLDDPNKFPDDVAIGSDGTVYVANESGPIGASGNVVVYAPGATSPTSTLNDQNFVHVQGVALDKNGNLFASCNAEPVSGTGTVVEFKAGSSTPIDTHIKLGFAAGIAIDADGHIVVADEEVPSLNVYAVGKKTPLHILKLPGVSAYIAFNKSSKVLYVSNFEKGEIDVFKYSPSKLTQTNTITNGITPSSGNYGVGVSPAQRL